MPSASHLLGALEPQLNNAILKLEPLWLQPQLHRVRHSSDQLERATAGCATAATAATAPEAPAAFHLETQRQHRAWVGAGASAIVLVIVANELLQPQREERAANGAFNRGHSLHCRSQKPPQRGRLAWRVNTSFPFCCPMSDCSFLTIVFSSCASRPGSDSAQVVLMTSVLISAW